MFTFIILFSFIEACWDQSVSEKKKLCFFMNWSLPETIVSLCADNDFFLFTSLSQCAVVSKPPITAAVISSILLKRNIKF